MKPVDQIPLMKGVENHASDHEFLAAFRKETPVARNEIGIIRVLTNDLVMKVLDDRVTRQMETDALRLLGVDEGPFFEAIEKIMLFANGDVHQRRREPVARTFAFKLMDAMRGDIQSYVSALIDEKLDSGPFDFLEGFASPIPARIIARILGVPEEDQKRFTGWVYQASRGLGLFPKEEKEQIDTAIKALGDYVESLFEERRQTPQDDFLTDYLAVTQKDGKLDAMEIRMQIAGLILAGSDTTRLALCTILTALMQHPEVWAEFCADPDGLKTSVVEEGLRFEPVVASVPRVTLEDMELGGYLIPKGRIITASVMSAMRDPEVFNKPHAFDIHRTDHQRWSLAFGHGPHRCLGEALARAELEETLALLARKAPALEIAGEPARISGLVGIRQLTGMKVLLKS